MAAWLAIAEFKFAVSVVLNDGAAAAEVRVHTSLFERAAVFGRARTPPMTSWLTTVVNWILCRFVNERLERFLVEPIRQCSLGACLRTGRLTVDVAHVAFIVSPPPPRSRRSCSGDVVVASARDLRIVVPVYNLRSDAICVSADEVAVRRRGAPADDRRQRCGDTDTCDAHDAADCRTHDDGDDDEDIFFAPVHRGAAPLAVDSDDDDANAEETGTHATLQNLFLCMVQNLCVRVAHVHVEWDAHKTFVLRNVRDVPDCAYGLHTDEVVLRGHQTQTVVAHPGIDVRWDEPLHKALVHVRGEVHFALSGSDAMRKWGFATQTTGGIGERATDATACDDDDDDGEEASGSDEEQDGVEVNGSALEPPSPPPPPWLARLHVYCEQGLKVALSEDVECASRSSASVVCAERCGYANGDCYASEVHLRHGDAHVRLKGVTGSSVHAVDVDVKQERVAALRDVRMRRRRMHVYVDGGRHTLHVRTTPAQTAALVNASHSLCTHLSAMFPLRLDNDDGCGGGDGTNNDDNGQDDDDDEDSSEGALLFAVDHDDSRGSSGGGSDDAVPEMTATTTTTTTTTIRNALRRPPRAAAPPRRQCPVYVRLSNVCLKWTMREPIGGTAAAPRASALHLYALVPSASFRQCDLPPPSRYGALTVQSAYAVTLKDWEVRDDVQRSHWRRLVSCGGTSEAPATIVGVVQKTRYRPHLAHAVQIRARTRPVRVQLHHATFDFLQRFVAQTRAGVGVGATPSATETCGDDDNDDKDHAEAGAHTCTVIERLDVERVRLVVDYKPRATTSGGLSEMVRTADYVYLLRTVPVEGATLRLRSVHLGDVPPRELGERLLALYAPNWHRFVAAYVAGVQPVHVALRLGASVFNLVKVPVREYRKGDDGDVWGAVQSGVRTVAVEVLRLGTRTSTLSYKALRGADRMLESKKDSRRCRRHGEATATTTTAHTVSTYADQPATLAEGAYESWRHVRRGVVGGVRAMTSDPYRAYRRGGTSSLIKATARGLPRLVLQPAMGVTGAVARMTQATCNVVDPQCKREADRQWKAAAAVRRE